MNFNIGNPYQSQQIAVNTPQLNQGGQLAKQLASGIAGAAGSAAGGPLGAIAAQAGVNLFSNLFEYGLNSYQAKKNRDFQASMSNTSYQRAVKDMLRAGLNPALMFNSGQGASTPSGAMASMRSNPTNLSELLLYKAQLDQIQSSARLSNANARLADEEARGKEIENDNKQDVISADLAYKNALSKLTDKQREQVDTAIKQITKGIELTNEQILQVKASVANLELQGEILNKQDFYYSWEHAKVIPILETSTTTIAGTSEYQNYLEQHGFTVGAKVDVYGEIGAEATAGVPGIGKAGVKNKVGGSAGLEGSYNKGSQDGSGTSSNQTAQVTLKGTDLLMLIPQRHKDGDGFIIKTFIIRDGLTYEVVPPQTR